ncbi:MAG TPA: tetratricopeptide repeat protein [Chitinophaga sp.]
MTSTRLLYNDDEYIDGLMESSPAIIDAIYRHFAKKVSSFILQHGGNKKDAAHIFEVALTDIYSYARRHTIELTTRFEPFFMLICKKAWRKELQRRGMDVREEAEAEIAALDNTHLKYVKEIIENGNKKRCWIQLFYQLTPACQSALQQALISPVADGASTNPQPTAGLLPELSAPCMATLIKSSLTQRSGKELLPGNSEQAALYVLQALPEAEKQAFEALLKEQPPLQEIVVQGREAIEWLRRTLTPDNTKRELMQILADMRQRWFYGKDRDNNKVGWYVMGITMLAIVMAGLLFISPWRKDIYRQFAPTEMVHHHTLNNDTSKLLHDAARNFNKRRFAEAVRLLNQVLEMDPSNSFARYYRGVCLVEMNQQPQARTDLQAVYGSNAPFRYDAAFYMALSFLKERDKQQSLEWLLKIPAQAAVYRKAQKLMEELR